MRKNRSKRATSDDRARDPENLDPEPEHGCQVFRRKVLCSQATFVIVGRVSICLECWERIMAIAADAHVDQLELRRRYEPDEPRPGPTEIGRGTAGDRIAPGREDGQADHARAPITRLIAKTA